MAPFIKAEHGRGIVRPPVRKTRDPGFNAGPHMRNAMEAALSKARDRMRPIDPGFHRGGFKGFPTNLPPIPFTHKPFDIDRGAKPGFGDYVPPGEFPTPIGASQPDDSWFPAGGFHSPGPSRGGFTDEGPPMQAPPQHPIDFGGMMGKAPQHPIPGLGGNPAIMQLIQQIMQMRQQPRPTWE